MTLHILGHIEFAIVKPVGSDRVRGKLPDAAGRIQKPAD